jgi:hypothetical protein
MIQGASVPNAIRTQAQQGMLELGIVIAEILIWFAFFASTQY